MKGVFGTKPAERERTREHEKMRKKLRVLLSSSDCGTGFVKPDKDDSFTDIRATKGYEKESVYGSFFGFQNNQVFFCLFLDFFKLNVKSN